MVQLLHWQHCDYKRGGSTEGDSGNDPGAGAEADPIHAKFSQPRYPSLPVAKKTSVFLQMQIQTQIYNRDYRGSITWTWRSRTAFVWNASSEKGTTAAGENIAKGTMDPGVDCFGSTLVWSSLVWCSRFAMAGLVW